MAFSEKDSYFLVRPSGKDGANAGLYHTVTEDRSHPGSCALRFRVVVWIPDCHLFDGIVLCDREPLAAKWEKVSDNWSIRLVPFARWYAAFLGDDSKELTPERKSRNRGNMPQWRNVEGINP